MTFKDRDPWAKILWCFSLMLFTFGALALGYSAFIFVKAHLYQAGVARQFPDTGRTPLAPALPPPNVTAQPLADGMPVGRFEIPRLKLHSESVIQIIYRLT
jgi:hypothetical protein